VRWRSTEEGGRGGPEAQDEENYILPVSNAEGEEGTCCKRAELEESTCSEERSWYYKRGGGGEMNFLSLSLFFTHSLSLSLSFYPEKFHS